MQQQLKHLGLTQLEKALPTLFETARQEQWTYELFLNRAIAALIEGRDRRAAERRMTAARLPTIKTLEATAVGISRSLVCPDHDQHRVPGTAGGWENTPQLGAHSKGEGRRRFGFVYHLDPPGRGAGHRFLSGPGSPAAASLYHPQCAGDRRGRVHQAFARTGASFL